MTVETAPRTTLVACVTNAAVTSVLLPVMAAAFVTVTVPVVAPPIAERPAAVAVVSVIINVLLPPALA